MRRYSVDYTGWTLRQLEDHAAAIKDVGKELPPALKRVRVGRQGRDGGRVMNRLADHENPLPEAVVARCADTDGAHCAQASSAVNPPTWHAVVCSPPDRPVYDLLRQCVTEEHASRVLAGLPETYLPAYAAQRQADGQWIPTGMQRGVQG
jgi:hypothetical protein